MARRPYTTTARFFRNDPRETRIKWVVADPAKGTFPGVSKICSLDWVTHPFTVEGVGEVYGTSRRYNGARGFGPIPGDHFCGTLQEHREGEQFNPLLPTMLYNPSGLPLCCDPNRREGAAVGSVTIRTTAYTERIYTSLSRVSVTAAGTPHTYGVVHSSAHVSVTTRCHPITDAPRQGKAVAIGIDKSRVLDDEPRYGSAVGRISATGEPTDEYPECMPLGSICEAAVQSQLDHGCPYTLDRIDDHVYEPLNGWRKWPVSPGGSYLLSGELDVGTFTSGMWELRRGDVCPGIPVDSGFLTGVSSFGAGVSAGPYRHVWLILTDVGSDFSEDVLRLRLDTA